MEATVIALLGLQAGGLTWKDYLADLPHDPPAIFTYALLAISGFLIWRGSRKKAGSR